jgi:hypothetical protein
MSVEITHREVMTFPNPQNTGSIELRVTMFSSGNAHLAIEVSGLWVGASLRSADLRKLGEAAIRAADVAEKVGVSA